MSVNTERLTFPRGGIHPPERKERTAHMPLVVSQPPAEAAVLMLQHIGAPAQPVVQKKDQVKKGDLIGQAQGLISANVHAPIGGTVKGIEDRIHNPTGRLVPAVIIENNGNEEWAEGRNQPQDVERMDPKRMVELVQEAGVVGLGGASFPAHVKLSPPPHTRVTDVIINGAECEPYLTCDHRLMLERSEDIVDALRLIMRCVGAQRGAIGIESNKPDAIEKLAALVRADPSIVLYPLQVKYPQGAEQQLITAVTGREVPAGGGLPSDVGCLVHNVATALAIRDAIRFRKPLIERPLTVSGDAVVNAGNFVERIGTSVKDILTRQGIVEGANLLLMGGPMMGVAQADMDVPLIKGNSGILLWRAEPVPPQRSCIRCGRCVDHCPLGLVPSDLSIVCETMDWEAAQELGLMECKECGCCAFVCPAKRRIVHLVRFGKAELAKKRRKEQERAQKKS
jgi:electron transport complex protein RnfC